MLIKICLISSLVTFFSVDLNKCNNNSNEQRITIVGRTFVNKFQAAVKTDDSLVYYLQGIYGWDEKYLGKRVKVKGKLMPILPPMVLIPGSYHTRQPRLRDGRFLKKPKWSLVE